METTSCRRGCSGVAVGPNRWRNDCSRTASMYLRADDGESLSCSWAACSTSVADGEGLVLMVASVAIVPVCTRWVDYMTIESEAGLRRAPSSAFRRQPGQPQSHAARAPWACRGFRFSACGLERADVRDRSRRAPVRNDSG